MPVFCGLNVLPVTPVPLRLPPIGCTLIISEASSKHKVLSVPAKLTVGISFTVVCNEVSFSQLFASV